MSECDREASIVRSPLGAVAPLRKKDNHIHINANLTVIYGTRQAQHSLIMFATELWSMNKNIILCICVVIFF